MKKFLLYSVSAVVVLLCVSCDNNTEKEDSVSTAFKSLKKLEDKIKGRDIIEEKILPDAKTPGKDSADIPSEEEGVGTRDTVWESGKQKNDEAKRKFMKNKFNSDKRKQMDDKRFDKEKNPAL